MSSSASLAGVVPILLTPVEDDGRLAVDDLRSEVDHVVAAGVSALGFGYASEPHRFAETERERALRVVVEHVAGRVLVVAQLQAGSTLSAALGAERLVRVGADALMVPAPVGGDERRLVDHYATVARAAQLPIVVQDAPVLGIPEMSVRCLACLATEIPEVVTIKVETPPTPQKVAQLVDAVRGNATVLGGMGGLEFFNELERGVNGTMPGPALVDVFVRVWELHHDGQREDAMELFACLLPILVLSLRSADTFTHVEKEILRRRGVISTAAMRAPAPAPDAGLLHELDLYGAALDIPKLVQPETVNPAAR